MKCLLNWHTESLDLLCSLERAAHLAVIEVAVQVPTDPRITVPAEELCRTLGWKAMGKELAVRIVAEMDKLFRLFSRRLSCRGWGEVQNRSEGRWR